MALVGIDLLKGIFGDKGLVGSVVDVLKDTGILKDPEQILKAQQALAEIEIRLEQEASKQIESINATIREESKSEHWIQYSWRPIIGFAFAGVIINNYILMPYFFKLGLAPIIIPEGVWSAMLVTLGVSAATRGFEKWQREKN